MMSAATAATTDGPDLEHALPEPAEPTTPAPKQHRKRTAAIAASILVCVGILVGVLAATPWKSDDASQQQQQPAAGAAPWPHSNSDLAPDAGVAYGTLDNGLRYMVMRNSEPPNQVMLRMHVDAGSYHEDDDQQGLAHFLEHMAFNGLRSYPDAEDLIPEMQRLGIAFGAHANAFTYFDETGYELDLPNATDEKALDIAFTVMRDYADGMLLEEEEIEKERGVILSELTFRDSVDYRLTKKLWSFLLPSHRLPLRWPGGDPDVISTVPRQRFVDFYGDHYTPDRITVIACGDMDPEEMEKRIVEAYESMEKREGDDMGDIDLGTVTTGSGFETAVFSDKELVNEELFLTFARPYDMPFDTESERIAQYPLAFAHNILSRRLSLAAKKEGSPFRSGSASGGGRAGILGRSGIGIGSISLTLASDNDDSWKESIAILEQEFRRALLYGFAPHELAEVVANYQSFYETQVDVAPTRESKRLAGQLLSTIKDEQVFTTPTENLRIFTKAVESISLDDMHEAFKSFWDVSDLKLVLYAKEAEPDATDVMEQLYNESKETEVDPPNMDVQTTFLYTEFGEPGEVVSDTTQEDLEIRQLRLSNNVRVNLKKTDFQASSIGLTARFGTGMLSQDGSKPGVQYFASQVMNGGGLGKHSNDDLSRILAGKNVGVSFSVGEGSFALSGGTTPEDLKLQLQLMAAQIVDPGWRSETLQYWQQSAASYDTMFKSKIDGAQYAVEEYLKNDDRFAVPSLEEMNALTIADVQEWLQPQLANSFLEISIVGAFDMENTISLILETFGALPYREESPPAIDDEPRALQFPDSPTERTFTYESKLPAASSIVAWKVPHIEEDISQSRQFSLLSSMLRDRLRVQIREDIGESYSPRASTDISDNFHYGIIRADSPGESGAVGAVGIQIVDIASKMAADMDEDELFRAREPIMTNLQKQNRSNSYWLNVMSSSQAKPHKLDWARSLESDFASVTLENLQELAVAYLTPDNALRMEIIPVNPPAE